MCALAFFCQELRTSLFHFNRIQESLLPEIVMQNEWTQVMIMHHFKVKRDLESTVDS